MNKNKLMRNIGVLMFFIGIVAYLVFEKYIFLRPFSKDRMILCVGLVTLLSINFIFNFTQLWEKIYKKRYIVGIIALTFVVANGYHGSSMGVYSSVIQPNITVKHDMPFWGVARGIRSDEFLVNTPTILSQVIYNKDLSSINKALMASDTTVLMFPQLPARNISTLTRIQNLGFFFLNAEQGFSFAWFFPYFALFFAAFELLMMMTKKKRSYALAGSLMIVLSPSIQWWGAPEIPLYGILATLAFSWFLDATGWKKKLMFSILLGWFGSCYIMTMYPAWMIPFGYLFLALFLWQLYEHREKIKWSDLLYIVPVICTIAILVLPAFLESAEALKRTTSTIYPGKRESTGGTGWELNYNYIHSIIFGSKIAGNSSESGQYISLYPIPIILGLIQFVRNWINKKQDVLLNLLLSVTIFLTMWNYIKVPLLSKLTMLSMSVPERSQVVVGMASVILIIYLMSKYATNAAISKSKLGLSMVMSLAAVLFALYTVNRTHSGYLSLSVALILFTFYMIVMVLFILNHKKTNFIVVISMICVSMYVGLSVHPISKGLNSLTGKPFAKEVQRISLENSNARWLTVNAPLYLQSYLLPNGAHVINSTNFYPNFEFWYTLDPTKKDEGIYNRYAHVFVQLTVEETEMILLQGDAVIIKMNVNGVCLVDTNYVSSMDGSLESLSSETTIFTKIYDEDGVSIYKVLCK